MADDPHRDLLPVKEGSCINTCRSSIIDHRERHAVCKLDRYQLEDRYLRLLDEVQDLKKLSNTQEDKIKRLATKLMRVAATPRSCHGTTRDFNNDRNRFECLEHENAKLKDKITVLRNQILNHKIGRSRSQRLQIYPTSGPGTFRSEIGRAKSSSSHLIHNIVDDKDGENYFGKIEDLEEQKKAMALRIAELESDLENHKAGKQRQKVAENVEFIRVWRQMKQQNEQLLSAQALNVSLTAQIRDLKEMLAEKSRSNKEITGALMIEKKKLSHIDEQFARAKNSQLSLRDRDEQIKDLMSEIKILHQHNAELIALSSKYSQVQRENGELKKKISEQSTDHQSLKSAFSNEQANITALQAANEQLIRKLHDLQRNIDGLTIQLKSFQCQNERQERSETDFRAVRTMDRETNTNSLPEKLVVSQQEADWDRGINTVWKKCCHECRERISKAKNMVNREMQTDFDSPARLIDSRPERIELKSPKRTYRNSTQSPMRADRSFQPDENGSVTLMPEEMLKLLEQAQINNSTVPNEYLNSTELSQRQRYFKYPGLEDLENCLTRLRKKKIAEINRCSWRNDNTCIGNNGCGYACSQRISKQEFSELEDNFQRYQHISNCIQKTFDNINMSRSVMRVDGRSLGESYKSCETSNTIRNSGLSNEKNCNVCQKTRWNCMIEQSEHEKSRETGVEKNLQDKRVSNAVLQCICCDKCKEVFPKKLHQSITRDSKYIKNGGSVLSTRNSDLRKDLLESQSRVKINSSQRDSTGDSFLSTSVEQSESSVIRAMEDEDATSEDIRNAVKKRQIGSTEQLIKKVESRLKVVGIENVDSESVTEFNTLIRNNAVLSPRGSRSSVQDVGNVFTENNWHEYKRRSMASRAKVSRPSVLLTEGRARASNFSADTSINNNAVIIRIESLSLDVKCPLLKDTDVHQLYVEFSFLGYNGSDLETISVQKPTEANITAYFNYMRKFEIDGEKHQMQRNIIRAMMSEDDNPTIKFIIVSEPLPEHVETKECIEVGYAYFNIRDHILSGNTNEVSLTIVNVKQTDLIGILKVALLGAEAIRHCITNIR